MVAPVGGSLLRVLLSKRQQCRKTFCNEPALSATEEFCHFQFEA
jgi:hypothetical protein